MTSCSANSTSGTSGSMREIPDITECYPCSRSTVLPMSPVAQGVDHGPWHQELRGKLICFDLLTDLGSAGALVTEVERDTPVHVFGDVLVEQQVPSAFDIHHRRSGKIDRVGEILLAQPRLPLAAYRGGAGSRSVGPARAGRTLPPVRSRSGASAGTRRWSRRSRSATAAPANTKSGAPRSPARGTDDGRRGTRRRRHD